MVFERGGPAKGGDSAIAFIADKCTSSVLHGRAKALEPAIKEELGVIRITRRDVARRADDIGRQDGDDSPLRWDQSLGHRLPPPIACAVGLASLKSIWTPILKLNDVAERLGRQRGDDRGGALLGPGAVPASLGRRLAGVFPDYWFLNLSQCSKSKVGFGRVGRTSNTRVSRDASPWSRVTVTTALCRPSARVVGRS